MEFLQSSNCDWALPAMKQKWLCETENEALCRRESDRLAKKQKWAHVNSNIDNAITLFTSRVQCGPEYVCTVCQRMLYKSSVIVFNESKYNNESDVLKSVLNEKYRHVSDDSKEWICRSCHNAMCRNNVPVLAKVGWTRVSPYTKWTKRLEYPWIANDITENTLYEAISITIW